MSVFLSVFLITITPYFSYITSILVYLVINFIKKKIYIFDSVCDEENTDKCLEYIIENCKHIFRFQLIKGIKKPESLCVDINNKFIAYIIHTSNNNKNVPSVNTKIYYIGNIHFKLCKPTNQEVSEKIQTIVIWDKQDDFRDSYIYKMNLPFTFEPYERQNEIMSEITELYKLSINKMFRCLIHGSPGCGKSFMGKLMTFKLNGQLATYINLSSPGSGFRQLYKRSSPSEENPLIIQIDEFDVLIKNIDNQENINYKHDWLITDCYNKASFNNYWSEFVIRYPYVIWLLTMNTEPEVINNIDPSYLRKNRIDKIIAY